MVFAPYDDNRVTYLAETDARNKRVKFGIKAKDRTKHVYVIGKTGMGKSTLLENMAVQDIQNGEGLAFIDPHGKTTDLLLEYVPENRIKDVVYIAPFDVEYPISFNVLESVDRDKRHLVVSGLMSTFKKIWEDAWSARMEYILTNTLLALLECPGSTLLGVNRMLSDKEYRKEVVSHVQDPSVKTFWTKEFANYTERQAAEAVPAIQNKVGQFTANPIIRNMIGQPKSSFDIREAMDSRKILIINLSKGKIGDDNMKLLGGLLVTKIYLAAMSRADVDDRTLKILPNFYLFVDEFQNFANASFADILSEARKYKLNLTIAHQYVEQMEEKVRAAVFGNVGTMITFRIGATDAEILEKEYAPVFTAEDLVNLGFAQIYLKLMIDGLTSAPFSAATLVPIPHPDKSYVKEILETSRKQFARPRADVEAEIIKFHEAEANSKAGGAKTASNNSKDKPRSNGNSNNVSNNKHSNGNFINNPSVLNTQLSGSVTQTQSPNIVTPTSLAGQNQNSDNTVTSSDNAKESENKFNQDVGDIASIKRQEIASKKLPHFDEKGSDGFTDIKSIPLSQLAPKPKTEYVQDKGRKDHKIKNNQHINDLKNALSDVLKRNGGSPKVQDNSIVKASGDTNKKPSDSTVQKRSDNTTQNVQKSPNDKSAPNNTGSNKSPNEVPEDVLKQVLDMK
jgi:energy-coupling factor transporter ATP-binding protein EcfA2